MLYTFKKVSKSNRQITETEVKSIHQTH